MIQRQWFRQTKGLLALFLALAGLSSCVYDKYDPSLCPQSIHLPLSLYISPTQEPSQTKMSDEVTQAQNQFRGMDFIRVLPFKAPGGAVQAADEIWGNPFAMELVGAGSVHIYDYSFFLTQANAVLIYGRAAAQGIPVSQADSLAFKRCNGSLLMPDFLQVKKAGEAGFRPEPYLNPWMQEKRYNTWRRDLVNYLNGILNSNVKYNGVTRSFKNPADYGNHPGLKAALEAFTNYGMLFSGSQEVLDGRLTALYRVVYPLAESAHNSLDYHDGTYYYVYQLAKAIVRSMNNTWRVSISGNGTNATVQLNEQAPASFGLPAGAYVLQYREGARQFSEQLDNKNNGVDHRVGLYTTDERYFVYPPSLCYWTASPLLTSEEKDVNSYYAGNPSWESVLAHYPGNEVQSKTRSAAVKEPLSLGVSRLLLRLQRPSSLTLDDSAGNLFRIDNSSFPLTGILVAGQRKVDYTFTPVSGADEYIVYDADVYDGDTPRAYLSSYEDSKDVSVLLFETEAGKDVPFALEFLNGSNSTIYGFDNLPILPGTHFYLLGNIDLAAGDPSGAFPAVFVKGHTTTVQARFSSLKNAHPVLPDLREVQLSVGVDVQMNWNYTPSVSIGISD